jgi:hypothetical protein
VSCAVNSWRCKGNATKCFAYRVRVEHIQTRLGRLVLFDLLNTVIQCISGHWNRFDVCCLVILLHLSPCGIGKQVK